MKCREKKSLDLPVKQVVERMIIFTPVKKNRTGMEGRPGPIQETPFRTTGIRVSGFCSGAVLCRP